MKKNILVTGGNGYVGSNLIRELALTKEYNIRTIIRKKSNISCLKNLLVKIYHGDFYDKEVLSEALKDVDVVIHTAGIVDTSDKREEEMMNINYYATKTLINECISHGVPKFIYISSSNVLTLCQDNIVDGKYVEAKNFNLNKASDWYTKTKALATNYVNFCGEKSYIDTTVIFPTSIIGPNFSKKTATHEMIDLFLNKKIKVKINGGYNFVDIRSVTSAILECIEKSKNGDSFIVGGDYISIKDIFDTLAKLTNQKSPKITIPNMAVLLGTRICDLLCKKKDKAPLFSTPAIKTVFKKADFDSTLAKKTLGYAQMPLIDSLKDTITALRPQPKHEQLALFLESEQG